MKKKTLTTSLLTMLTALTVTAQIEKGSWMIGGQAGYSNTEQKSRTIAGGNIQTNSRSGNYDISAGFAFKENNVAGLSLLYAPTITTLETSTADGAFSNSNKTKTHTKGIGIFYRNYLPLNARFFFFGQGDLTYTNGRERPENQVQAAGTINTGRLSVSPGISFEVSKCLQMELAIPSIIGVQYTNTTAQANDFSQNSGSTSFTVATNLNARLLENLGLGFKLFL